MPDRWIKLFMEPVNDLLMALGVFLELKALATNNYPLQQNILFYKVVSFLSFFFEYTNSYIYSWKFTNQYQI